MYRIPSRTALADHRLLGFLCVTGNLNYDDLNNEARYPVGTQIRIMELCKVHDFWNYGGKQ
jgi:hypothetical protein